MAAVYKRLDEVAVEDIAAAGLPPDEAARVHEELARVLRETGGGSRPEQTWQCLSRRVLRPEQPFAVHQMMFYGCYRDYGNDTPPAWIPDLNTAVSTNIGRILQSRGKEFLGFVYKDPISNFSDFQKFSVLNPEVYWNLVLNEMGISFSVPPTCILQDHSSYPGGKWLPGAVLNAAENCLSLNDKRGLDDVAIVWRDEGCDDLPINHMTLKELREEVCTASRALEMLGLPKGSAVAIDMPMTVTSVIIYLAIVTAGFVVVSIADSFASTEISTRLKISDAKAIFTQDYIIRGDKKIPLYSRVIEANAPSTIVVPTSGSSYSRELRESDIPWHDFLERAKTSEIGEYTAVNVPVEAFSNILFSSGTTGEPKAIPWTHATPLKAAADAWAHMDIHKGDIVCWPTNLGWMMGPWLVYATLINGACMALYNGSPLGAGFAKFVQLQGTPGIGELALYPTMFGASTTLLNADHYNVYFRGMPLWNGKVLRRHGDEFEITATGYYRAHGRADDTMNLGGIKVSSVEIERICNGVNGDILETAAIGVPPSGGGPEQLVVAVVFKEQNQSEEKLKQLKAAFNASLQKKLNPLFKVSKVVAVPSFPRTASNKIMRRLLRQQLSHDKGAKL